ncbi:hypothetical protein Taro_030698 [Colocasia esculenta]|uniref:Uncharacterized protein n=1 Tax=Colocasia esculenta TaxID=4460 RepID=A0A843VGZ2_COLES|nr:hypothetical protein [Colocasia esculenta]
MPIPQPFFPSYNRTPKHHGYLNTLHQTLGTSFRTCWGRLEEFLVARELWIDHKKLIFFPFSSAATCTNHLLGVELRARRVSKGSSLAPMTASHKYTVNHREFLVARELWIDHKKLIFFPFSSTATCTNHLLGVELRIRRKPVNTAAR